jgi:hypothetical protein
MTDEFTEENDDTMECGKCGFIVEDSDDLEFSQDEDCMLCEDCMLTRFSEYD